VSEDITINVSGLDEIRRALQSIIPQHFQGAALQKMLTAAAAPIIAAAKERAPVKTGTLQGDIYSFKHPDSTVTYEIRGITVRTGKYAKRTKTHGDAYYWKWIEYGHGQIVTDGKTLGTPQSGYFGKVVAAYPAHPFMRPAFDSQKFNALQAFQDAATKQLGIAANA
jgi:HK97 gp10 family phage protein